MTQTTHDCLGPGCHWCEEEEAGQPVTTITPDDIAKHFGTQLIDQDNLSKTLDYEKIYKDGIALIRQFEEQIREEMRNAKLSTNTNFSWRKKPVVIEAFRVALPWKETWPDWAQTAYSQGIIRAAPTEGDHEGLAIKTLEGTMIARKGYWIIKGVKGELYPCKPDIFEVTYEQV
jgi:hypothetical protein